jgi:hypothetical protein
MSQVKQREPLYQVWATERATGNLVVVPFFPRIAKEIAEEYASTMRLMIAQGNEKRYSDPQALLHMREPN